jgi:uncharacterized protein (DUF1697 family)
MRCAAFLRGINVGGKNLVKMADVAAAFQEAGLTDVRTVLASGNVVFDGGRAAEASLVRRIEAALATAFGRDLKVLVRSADELHRLARAAPFGGVRITPHIRTFATFLQHAPGRSHALPEGPGFRIVGLIDRTVLTTVDLSAGMTTDLMRVLEQAFGRELTTRSWNTVERILKLLPVDAAGVLTSDRSRRP